MANKQDLASWLLEALLALGGRGRLAEIARFIWEHHEAELRSSGDLFYTWQYELRWAAHKLRGRHVLRPADLSPKGVWELL